MEKIKLIIFDMDGLILDTEKLYLEYGLEVFEELGYDITEEVFLGTVGMTDKSSGEYYSKLYGENFDYNIIVEKIDVKLLVTSKDGKVGLKNGLFELLKFLDENDVKKVVATSTARKKAEFMLENAGILDRFDFLVCGDEVKKGKPNPEIFLKAAEIAGVDPKNCMVLEDSHNGLRAANSAGMLPVMIPDLLEINEEIEKIVFKNLKTLDNVIEILVI
ncbi:MAG: HAD family phosphatase [Sebaldella sp.]|nr:HAD family phosphatase [Sebaldella sp.]